MHRRAFIAAAAGGLLAAPLAAARGRLHSDSEEWKLRE
jgi:hypothetical protein